MALYLKIEVEPIGDAKTLDYRKKLFLNKYVPKIGNASKPETVAKKTRESYESFIQELDSKSGLSPFLSKIVAGSILLVSEDDSQEKKFKALHGDEKEILHTIVDIVLQHSKEHTIVTFNGASFDIPFIIIRLILNGISPNLVNSFSYVTKFHLDLMYLLGKGMYGTMGFSDFVQLKFGKILQYPWINKEEFCNSANLNENDCDTEYMNYLQEKSKEFVKYLYFAFTKEELSYDPEGFVEIDLSPEVKEILRSKKKDEIDIVEDDFNEFDSSHKEDAPPVKSDSSSLEKDKEDKSKSKKAKTVTKKKTTKKNTKGKKKETVTIKKDLKGVSLDDI